MRKNKRDAAPTKDLTVKALLADVFGLNRTAEQKARSRKEIPWQWALWGALLFFCVGFLVPTESLWIILLAIGVAVIIYMARASETVEPQVFLLTDNRTDEQKAAFERRTNKSRTRRPARPKTEKVEKAEKVEKTEKAASETKEATKPARPPRKPRAPKPEVTPTTVAEEKAVTQAPVAEPVEVPAEPKVAPEVKSEAPATESKPKAKPRTRRPRTSTNAAPRTNAPRRPRKPKAQPALTSAPVVTDKAE